MADSTRTTTRRRKLRALSIEELGVLYDAYAQASDVFIGLQNMPLCEAVLEKISENHMIDMQTLGYEVHDECLGREPSDTFEAAILARIIAGEAFNTDEWEAAASMIDRARALKKASSEAACRRWGLETGEGRIDG